MTLLICALLPYKTYWKENRKEFPSKSIFVFHSLHLDSFQEGDCSAKCLAIPACTHYAWKPLDSGTCFFKSGTVSKMDAMPSVDSQSGICGVIPLNNTQDSRIFCDFEGQNLGQVTVPQELCATACRKAEKCTHCVWTESNDGGTCRLKFNPTATMSELIKTKRFSVCWLIREKIPGKSFRQFRWNEETNSAERCDFIGGNLKMEPSTRQECPGRCSQLLECTHYVW